MEKIYVAKLGKTVGLKGQMKIYIESDFPEQFKKGATFTTNKNQTLQIESINTSSNLVKFVGIDYIDQAKKYINSTLFTSYEASKENCELEDNQYFWFDIVDCKVFEDGNLLGVVTDINRYPTDDYLLIKTDNELVKQDEKTAKSFLLPYNEHFVIDVDIESKTINVKNAVDILEAS
jgi:16S rRNA processing protein RimM